MTQFIEEFTLVEQPPAPKAGPRPLHEIAREIRTNWKPVNYAAKPYLDAMAQLTSINENYGWDTGTSVVCYFLTNARTWRGDTARRVKAELKKMAGIR